MADDRERDGMADFLDRARDLAKDLTDRARVAVGDNAERIDGGIDRAAEFVDEKTNGRYADKIDRAQSAAHRTVERIAADPGDESGDRHPR